MTSKIYISLTISVKSLFSKKTRSNSILLHYYHRFPFCSSLSFFSLSCPIHLVSPILRGWRRYRTPYFGWAVFLLVPVDFFSTATMKRFLWLLFSWVVKSSHFTRLWAVGLNADRRAPSWITPHQTLQSLTIYLAKHRWEGSPLLFHAHAFTLVYTYTHTYTQTCCTDAHAQENRIWGAEKHLCTPAHTHTHTHSLLDQIHACTHARTRTYEQPVKYAPYLWLKNQMQKRNIY